MPAKPTSTKTASRKITQPAKTAKLPKTQPGGRRPKMSQGMLITVISASATVVAALLAVIPEMLDRLSPAPTATLAPTLTATLAPPTVTPTASPTFTPEPPTFTPTPETGIFGVYLSQDINGESKTASFAPSQTIFMFFNINDPSGLNAVKIVWSVVEVPGYKPGAVIHQTEDVIRKASYSVQANKAPWDPGKYRVDLYLNGILNQTFEFEILK